MALSPEENNRPCEEREDYMQLVSLYFHSIIYVQLHYLLLIHLLDGYSLRANKKKT